MSGPRDALASLVIDVTTVAAIAELSGDWAPWKFQVCTYGNGDAYGRPGKRICTGMANFLNEQDARAHFDFINKLRGAKP